MNMRVPILQTDRLIVRPFVMDDLFAIHRILTDAFGGETTLVERREWLQWTVLNYEQLARLNQPPYGDRAVVLQQTGAVIGACGYVPRLDVHGQLPSLAIASAPGLTTTEFAMFWAIAPEQQRCGYATEAARAMLDHAFNALCLHRVIATTDYDNFASQAVMRKLGMRLERNPRSEPPWLQVVGVRENVL